MQQSTDKENLKNWLFAHYLRLDYHLHITLHRFFQTFPDWTKVHLKLIYVLKDIGYPENFINDRF